jgi:hypothetical protein
VAQNCCSQWTACAADTACTAIAQCVATCAATDGGDPQTCTTKCGADASATGLTEFEAFGLCLEGSCAGPPGDGGGGEGGPSDSGEGG